MTMVNVLNVTVLAVNVRMVAINNVPNVLMDSIYKVEHNVFKNAIADTINKVPHVKNVMMSVQNVMKIQANVQNAQKDNYYKEQNVKSNVMMDIITTMANAHNVLKAVLIVHHQMNAHNVVKDSYYKKNNANQVVRKENT